MPIECLAEMIVEIDKKPPVTDEEFDEAIEHWREREKEVHKTQHLDYALLLISRAEIESIIKYRRFRDDSYVRQIRGPDLKPSKNHGGVRTKGGEKPTVTFIGDGK